MDWFIDSTQDRFNGEIENIKRWGMWHSDMVINFENDITSSKSKMRATLFTNADLPPSFAVRYKQVQEIKAALQRGISYQDFKAKNMEGLSPNIPFWFFNYINSKQIPGGQRVTIAPVDKNLWDKVQTSLRTTGKTPEDETWARIEAKTELLIGQANAAKASQHRDGNQEMYNKLMNLFSTIKSSFSPANDVRFS